jgi:hypothetical protein
MKVGFAVLLFAVFVGCASTGGQSLGSIVYIDAGSPTQVPAGLTRTASDQISTSLAANDMTGVNSLILNDEAVYVDRCSSGKLIDTAAGGEREIRLDNGQAVWVDANWVKSSCS